MKNFFKKLLYDRYNRIPTDVYTSIFLCDFINIFVFVFGFAAVTVSDLAHFILETLRKFYYLRFFISNIYT